MRRNPLDKYVKSDQVVVSERFKFHLENKTLSLAEYREKQRIAIRDRIQFKRVVYLDTNAWKCLSDYERKKRAKLTDEMVDFARTMNSDEVRNSCVFPIGIATLFEIQSMDERSVSTLAMLIEKFSMNVGYRSPDLIINQELALFNRRETRDAGAEPIRYCHPMEIMGDLEINVPSLLPVEETLAFKKTILDLTYALPAAAHLEMGASYGNRRWDNTEGIDEMNEGMIAHQHEIKTFQDAIFVELTGIMKFHVPNDAPPINGYTPQKAQALMAMGHWHKNPRSRHLITARIQANLHAAIRHIENRKFREGDIADFATGQIALPSAHALFTDKAFANLLNEPEIGLKRFCSCEVVSGFSNFAAYLKTVSAQPGAH